MLRDFIASLLGGLTAVSLGLIALKYLTTWFIEHRLNKALEDHRHGLATQLAQLHANLARVGDVLSRRNEREFAVTENAWDLLIRAAGEAQSGLGGLRRVPAFFRLDEDEALRVIDGLSFAESDKNRLRAVAGQERDDLYSRLDRKYAVLSSLKAWADFKNFVSTRQIFFTATIYAQFISIRDELHGTLIRLEMYAEDEERMPFEARSNAERFLMVDLNDKIDQLAGTIRGRFGFGDQERDSEGTSSPAGY